MTQLFHQMTICGVGLIGGSLALVARARGWSARSSGWAARRPISTSRSSAGSIDRATRDPAKAARGADLVMLAAPIRTMPATLAAMAPHLPPDAVVTDVGSVKGWVVRELEPLLGPAMALVAAHPVAGKETTGAAAADAGAVRGPARDHHAVGAQHARGDRARSRRCGARPARGSSGWRPICTTRSSRARAICRRSSRARWPRRWPTSGSAGQLAAEFGAGGLRDTTRLAASSAEMWRDICLTNREAILAALALSRDARGVSRAVERRDGAGLRRIFERGREMRERLK